MSEIDYLRDALRASQAREAMHLNRWAALASMAQESLDEQKDYVDAETVLGHYSEMLATPSPAPLLVVAVRASVEYVRARNEYDDSKGDESQTRLDRGIESLDAAVDALLADPTSKLAWGKEG